MKHIYIRIKKYTLKEILYFAFLIFCFIPFLFPNQVVDTNIQPYAALLGTLIVIFKFPLLWRTIYSKITLIVLGGTFLISLIVMICGMLSLEAVRGVYNYYALFIIPCAVIIVLEELEEFPEKLVKLLILLWFVVATVQFFVYRGFATTLISGVRWSYAYRGVVGLASEPSFFGIACFCFLHIIKKFKTQRVLFFGITLIMGSLYAQSTIGIIFIIGFYMVFLLDVINTKKGVYIWGGSILASVIFIQYLNTELVGSRLNQMITIFFDGGIDSILLDESASTRFNAIRQSIGTATANLFFPSGFDARIGSAYGGFLVELGFFAIPAIVFISYSFALTFKNKRSKIIYFVVVTLLLLNNTQIGNPLLLVVIGINLHSSYKDKKFMEAKEHNARNYQRT